MSYRYVLLLSPVLAMAPASHAETLYVIEQLVVNVNSAPDSSGERVTSIKSGEAVEVLDRQGDQVHVHLANGSEGWVKKSYLSSEEPLQQRLNESHAEVEKLKQDVKRLESDLAAAQTAARMPRGTQPDLSSGSSALPNPPPAMAISQARSPTVGGPTSISSSASGLGPTGVTAAKSAPPVPASAPKGRGEDAHSGESAIDSSVSEPSYFMTPPEAPARPMWHWTLASSLIALALGFALGWQMLDRRIRRKYGGLRIY